MKSFYFSFCILSTLICNGIAQNDDYQREHKAKAQLWKIINLIKQDDVGQLAEFVAYPLIRPDPVPDIETKESFILYYPTLFDKSFKSILLDTTEFYCNMIVDQYSYAVGFHSGDLYLDEKGLIASINFNSQKEVELIKVLNNETLSLLHPSIEKWKEPILTLKSDNYLIRVDLMNDNSVRYISWSSTKKIWDKPDLILTHGVMEYQGTMGGITYTFKNGDWTYVVDFVNVCDEVINCGYFLRLYQNDIEKKSIRMIKIK
jgi:hypothetical protein